MSKPNTSWILLVATLPASSTASRMRLWRAVKSLGCATLRDGVLRKLADEATCSAWLL